MKVLIVADIHANLAALEAVLATAPAVDTVWNLGDSVGYGPWPAATLARLATLRPGVTLAGNHDLAAIGRLDLSAFNAWARAAARWTGRQLSQADAEWLATRPSLATAAAFPAGVMTLVHGSPRDPIWEYVTDASVAAASVAAVQTPVCWVGHTHVPMIARHDDRGRTALRPVRDGEVIALGDDRWLINPGSVGQPRDGDPRASYALLDTDAGAAAIHRVPYDIGRTQRQMAAAGLPLPLIERLSLGV